MTILINKDTQAVVQGITGREATSMVKLMRAYGTNLVGGTSPGKAGQFVEDVEVFNTVKEIKEKFPKADTSVVFVPASGALDAAMEAMEAGMKTVVLCPERVPQHDMLKLIAYSKEYDCKVIGPNTVGVISPGECTLGMIGGRIDAAQTLFKKGPVGVISRSGSGAQVVPYFLTREGIGQSTVMSTGGDTFVGTPWTELLELYEKDPETKAVVGFGEIGNTLEEDVADMIEAGKFTKPFICYIAGKYALPNVRFGHAGAIISGGKGTAAGKIERLREVGATVVDHLPEIGKEVAKLI